MDESIEKLIMRFGRDSTVRWSCRDGDFLIWYRCTSGLLDEKYSFTVPDVWEMRDGDYVTITNRWADLPPWFELHPTEVRNALAFEMVRRVKEGYKPPGEIMDGPNLWRLCAGDRVAWVGGPRPDRESLEGLLAILDCGTCALAIGESNQPRLWEGLLFGALSREVQGSEHIALCNRATRQVRLLGFSGNREIEWRLG